MGLVREPQVQYDGRGMIATHGTAHPLRGVWHSTECGDSQGITELTGVLAFWKQQGLGYGAQLLIDKDGNSALAASPDAIVWAVENHNSGTFSIELIGFARFSLLTWLTRRKQLDKLARWMAWLRKEYGIPLDFSVNRGWSRHLDQSRAFGGTHTDPGIGFPCRLVLRKARKYLKEGWA